MWVKSTPHKDYNLKSCKIIDFKIMRDKKKKPIKVVIDDTSSIFYSDKQTIK